MLLIFSAAVPVFRGQNARAGCADELGTIDHAVLGDGMRAARSDGPHGVEPSGDGGL